MAQIFLSELKIALNDCIDELDKIHFMFCKNPQSDFTRNRKLSFRDYIQLMLQMQGKSVSNELLDFYEHSLSAPSKSAFTQQRYKLLPEVKDINSNGILSAYDLPDSEFDTCIRTTLTRRHFN